MSTTVFADTCKISYGEDKLQKCNAMAITNTFIRYDYYKQKLVIRMPSGLHELFIRKVDNDITNQLKAIGESVDVARYIDSLGSADLKFEESRHSPDAAFKHRNSRYPHLVIEVSYSQKQKDLAYLADDYIVESNESIGMVIGLDIEYYRGTKKAMLQMWRPTVTKEGGEEYLESQMVISEVRCVLLDIELGEANGKRHFVMKMERAPKEA